MASQTISTHTRQVKVKQEFPKKLFYEKILIDWKDSIADKNHASVIRKALENLRKYPLEINGYTELKNIYGIGENIATRLDAAWQLICSQYWKEPDLRDIRALKKGDAMKFLNEAVVFKGRNDRIPFLPRNKTTMNSKSNPTTLNAAMSLSQPSTSLVKTVSANFGARQVQPVDDLNVSFSQPLPTLREEPIEENFGALPTPILGTSKNLSPKLTNQPRSLASQADNTAQNAYIDHDPSRFDRCEVWLIVDAREGIARGRALSICQHLDKLGIRYEERQLSVGDFLWVLKFEDKEMVMDCIVERKTLDDLKHSIRETRYAEQKKRLKECGVRNVIFLLEGSNTVKNRDLEQALATTSIENRFLVQRTSNIQGTASFLAGVTERLKTRALTDHMVGLSFTSFQKEGLKTTTITVKDLWIRQLTVCPRMSVEKAKMIAHRFPTFRLLSEFYRKNRESVSPIAPEQLMSETIPGIPRSLSQQLAAFFSNI
uniref:Crossover junction endonuclease MUS81 n=1 Tax=Acrobeloides nanus TaxID=290746 RepID=A0A914CBM3_9BILA